MVTRTRLDATDCRASAPRRLFMTGLLLFVIAGLGASTAAAQRPVRIYDPFYRDETARRTFFDRYAFTGEISYRPAGLLQSDGLRTPGADPLGLSFRFDYQFATRFDLSVLMDAAGNTSGRTLSINWIALKYYRTVEVTDYALRLAVDPSSDGRSGFPQMDFAFLYTTLMTPDLSTDFAVGLRRVRIGYHQLVPTDPLPPPDPDDPIVSAQPADLEVLRSRARGWEMHMMMSYNIHFDPAGSNLFVTFLGEGGKYDLVEWTSSTEITSEDADRSVLDYQGGILWVRSGLEIERPSYQFKPFLSIPLAQWAPEAGEWPRSRLHIGVQMMLR